MPKGTSIAGWLRGAVRRSSRDMSCEALAHQLQVVIAAQQNSRPSETDPATDARAASAARAVDSLVSVKDRRSA